MDLHNPFAGQLTIPDTLLPHGESPVELPDGQVVAQISRHMLKWGSFRILNAEGQEVAEGRSTGLLRRKYQLAGGGQTLLELSLGWRGISGRSTVTLPDGSQLTVRGSSFRRRFRILDPNGTEVGVIQAARGLMAMSRHSYVASLQQPVLSIVQLTGLAQCLRKADKSARSSNRRGVGGVSRAGFTGGALGSAMRTASRNAGGRNSSGSNAGSIVTGIARGVARSRRRRR